MDPGPPLLRYPTDPGRAAQKPSHEPSQRVRARARGILHPGAPQHTPRRRPDYPTLLLSKELNDARHGGRDFGCPARARTGPRPHFATPLLVAQMRIRPSPAPDRARCICRPALTPSSTSTLRVIAMREERSRARGSTVWSGRVQAGRAPPRDRDGAILANQVRRARWLQVPVRERMQGRRVCAGG